MTTPIEIGRARARAGALRAEYESALRELVEIQSVSAHAERKDDIRRCGEAAAAWIRRFGGKARLVETQGNPVVVGELGSGDPARAVAFYNHLDVQPAGGDAWTTEPFRWVSKDGRYFGRGTTDDKGPALAALFGARLAADMGVSFRARFVWELEEEIGSPSFPGFLVSSRGELACESVVVSDTIWISRERPAIPYALRGMLTAVMRLESAANDTHSGDTGGVVRNPVAELCQVIASCVDASTARVLIPGFYDDVEEASEAELDAFETSGFDLAEFREAYGLRRLYHQKARDVLKAMWALPTFETHGIAGGYQGEGVASILPPRAEAKVSMRLVPNQTPERIAGLLRAHVARVNPDVQVIVGKGLPPYIAPFAGPHADSAKEAFRFAFGAPPALVREGGSIGPALPLAETLGAPVLFLGLSLPEHGYHAPNENFDWTQASGGMLAFARYLQLRSGAQ
jgi:acetylornithine deacetylase/succinyl-diaminopimelate desuccinylase-like protein